MDRNIALSLSISHTLHLATPTLGNGSEALNPAGFTVFDKVSQGGADLKDCSRSSIIFNQCRVILRRINLRKLKGMETKMLTSYLLTFFFKVEIFCFVKSHIATRLAFYPIPNWRITPHWSILIIFIAMQFKTAADKLNKQCLL